MFRRKLMICAIALTALLLTGCTQNNTDGQTQLSEEEAKKIALNQVSGATAEDIREFKSDYDHNKLKYEGKIYYQEQEYEFEIDGANGTILEWSVEPIYDR